LVTGAGGFVAVVSSKSIDWANACRLAVDDYASLVGRASNGIASLLIDWLASESDGGVIRRNGGESFNASAGSFNASRVGNARAVNVGTSSIGSNAIRWNSSISANAESFSAGGCNAFSAHVYEPASVLGIASN